MMYSSRNSALVARLSGCAVIVVLDGEVEGELEVDIDGAGYRYSKTRSSRRIHFRALSWRSGDWAKEAGVKSR